MKNNKIMKASLMLITAVGITLGISGCSGSSSLSDSEVADKIKMLAIGERAQMGYNVSVRCVRGRSAGLFLTICHFFVNIPKCDEMWLAEIHSDKWSSCMVRLCRRGSNYFLDFNPQDK